VESEAILATHRLAGRGHHHSQDRLNITVVRYIAKTEPRMRSNV
jgi:hypothetical protein